VLAILRQGRWIGFTLLTLFFIALFARLAIWQMDRRQQRLAANRIISAQLDAKPLQYAALDQATAADPRFASAHQWRSISVTGTWDAAHQFVWRNQALGNNWGYDVLTPLLPASGPAILIDRGWIPAGQTSAGPNSVPAPASGTVTVRAWLQPSQPGARPHGIPAGQVLVVDTASMARGLPYPLIDGYGQLVHESPASPHAPSTQPGPALDDGPHLAYAVEWVLFAFIAIGGWWVYVRRAVEDAAAGDADRSTTSRPGGGSGSDTSPPPVPAGVGPSRPEVKLPPSIQQIG